MATWGCFCHCARGSWSHFFRSVEFYEGMIPSMDGFVVLLCSLAAWNSGQLLAEQLCQELLGWPSLVCCNFGGIAME